MTYYEIGRLGFDLLPLLLPRIQGPAVSHMHDILLGLPTFYLIQDYPTFYLRQDNPLGSEMVKAMQAIEEFLKV
jgi:hypothetical protein